MKGQTYCLALQFLNLFCSLTVICVRFDRARLLKAIVALFNCFGAGTHIRVFVMR